MLSRVLSARREENLKPREEFIDWFINIKSPWAVCPAEWIINHWCDPFTLFDPPNTTINKQISLEFKSD